jgi:hypothetical protein
MRRGSIADKFLQPSDIVRRDALRVSEGPRDRIGHADFVEVDVRIAGDDGARGEVDALTHQVAPQPAFLAFQARADRLDRPSTLLQGLRLTGNVVVHVGRRRVLELGDVLVDEMSGLTLSFDATQVGIDAEDLEELVGQVVLAAHGAAVDGDARPDGGRRDGEDGEDHPLGSRFVHVEAHNREVRVGNLAEDAQCIGTGQRPPLLLLRALGTALVIVGLLGVDQLETDAVPADRRLHLAAAAVVPLPRLDETGGQVHFDDRRLFVFLVLGGVGLADDLALCAAERCPLVAVPGRRTAQRLWIWPSRRFGSRAYCFTVAASFGSLQTLSKESGRSACIGTHDKSSLSLPQ